MSDQQIPCSFRRNNSKIGACEQDQESLRGQWWEGPRAWVYVKLKRGSTWCLLGHEPKVHMGLGQKLAWSHQGN